MKIHLGIPCHENKINVDTAQDITKLTLEVKEHEDELTISTPTSPFISLNRNLIMQSGLDADWILQIDSDIQVPTPEFLYKMIDTAYRHDAVLTGLLCRLKLDETEFACGMKAKDGSGYIRLTKAPTQPMEVDVLGAGVTLIKCDWIKNNLEQPYYEFRDQKNADGTPGIEPEDWVFAQKIKEKGGKVVVEPRIETIHWGIRSYHYQIK